MSISPISSLLSSLITPKGAVSSQNASVHSEIAQYGIKDEIKLSKEAVALLQGFSSAPIQK